MFHIENLSLLFYQIRQKMNNVISGETIHRCIGASRYAEQRYTYRYTWCRIDTLNASIQVFVFATSVCPVCKMTFFKAHFIGLAKTVYPGVQLLGSMAP